jgi:cytosine/adenosine deaminase-related metal-dependent hydrolase
MTGPVLEDGAVACADAEVVAAGRRADLRREFGGFDTIDFGDAVILPGLVNAHTHLELTGFGQLPRPATFVDWVLELRRRFPGNADVPAFVRDGVRRGVAQCLACGVTTVGDVTLNPALTRPILREFGMAGVSFGEVLGMAGRRGQLEGRLAAAVDRAHEGEGLRVGIEPHAPYSVDLEGYRQCVAEADAGDRPLATHLAETADEAEFLAGHGGEFGRLWAAIGDWSAGVPTFERGPIRAMEGVGLLARPAVLAHVNYVSDEELDVLARGRASVVYCPRTHAYFGHPPHRYAEMLARGINVAIGTDSAASSPDLDLLEDLRLVHRLRPEVPPGVLFEMVTTRAARALGMEGRVGRLSPGLRADYCVYAVGRSDPLLDLLKADRELLAVGRAGSDSTGGGGG